MIRGGNATLSVSDMDRALRFYIETLGMKLALREGAGFAVVDAGGGFCVGLRLRAAGAAAPASGAEAVCAIGFAVDKLDDVIAVLANRGVAFDGARFADPDGNPLYLYDPPAA